MQRSHQRFLLSGASVLVTMAITAAIATGVVNDSYDERLDDLETRVAHLEDVTGIATAEATDQARSPESESSQSSSSASSSTQNSTSSFSASYSSSGSVEETLEISSAATYNVTVQATAPLSMRIETTGGEVVPGFSHELEGDGTLNASAELQPGSYVLHVESSSQWVVVITSISD